MPLQIEQITALFQAQGAVQYGAEAINQQQHALQCAHLAEQAGSAPALIAATPPDWAHYVGVLIAAQGR